MSPLLYVLLGAAVGFLAAHFLAGCFDLKLAGRARRAALDALALNSRLQREADELWRALSPKLWSEGHRRAWLKDAASPDLRLHRLREEVARRLRH